MTRAVAAVAAALADGPATPAQLAAGAALFAAVMALLLMVPA